MSENEKPVETAPVCRKSSDARTFCIALLTAIVVVAAYHVGTRLCRMFCHAPGACSKPAVTYMLIPVVNAPGRPMMHGPHGGKPGFRHGRPMGGHEGADMPGPGKRMRKGPGFRKGPAPADAPAAAPADKAAPAPKAPAPKQDAVTGATAKPAAK